MSDVAPGQRIDDFEILEVAGRGGMGVVYRARQVSLDRIVAFKLIAAAIVADPDYLARFAREAKVAAAVEHAHVVRVYGAGRHGDRPYIAMQWVDGVDLRTLIDDHGAMTPERTCSIATQLGSALDAVHDRGLVHRDLKPGNVLLQRVKRRDHVYLTDFGIAKFVQQETAPLTKTGHLVGSPGYIAPECLRGADGDRRSDVYAMGCLLFECLTGERPFPATNELALYWAHANDPRPKLSERRPYMGGRFDAVLAQAMAIAPHERFQTGAAFAQALSTALESGTRPVAIPPPGAPAMPPPPSPSAASGTSDVASPPAPPTPAPVPQPAAGPPRERVAARVGPPPQRTRTAPTRPRPPVAPPPGPPPAAPRRGGLTPAARAALGAGALGGVIVALLLATEPFSGSDGGSTEERADARADVAAVLRRYERAFREPGVSALRPLLTPDVTRRASESGRCRETSGRPAVLAAYRQRSAARSSYSLPDLSARDVVLVGRDRARVTTRFTVPSSNSAGVTVFSLARRAEGWRITRVAAVNC